MNLRQQITPILRQAHKVLGLLLALYALVMGLTGALILYKDDLHAWLEPELHQGPAPAFLANPDFVMTEIRARYPGWRPLSFTWPHEHTPYWMIFLLKETESLEVYVDTRSGKVVGTHDPRSGWLGFAERVHSNWAWGRNGRLLNGYGAIALVLLSLSGLWLVLPRLRTLRFVGARDWHYAIGALSFLFLMGIAFTGAYYTWSKNYIDFAKAYLGRSLEPELSPNPRAAVQPIWKLMRLAQEAYPNKAIHRFPIPDARFPLRVTFREDTFAAFHRVSSVTLDPRDGAVLQVQYVDQRRAGDKFLGWLSAFHFGIFGGRPIQFLWALFGLGTAALAASGVWIWWRSR